MRYAKEKLRILRKKHHMTQGELAEKIGVKHNTISDYETGYSKPNAVRLIRIANVFNVSLDYFFVSGEDDVEILGKRKKVRER
ncbi:MAG: helix-turn-helix domain-containing protein [Clostridia bacterium]|nr:helix-turn-helix domain-containing protein [Clostridia bacterium]